jgi:hypothetical protein
MRFEKAPNSAFHGKCFTDRYPGFRLFCGCCKPGFQIPLIKPRTGIKGLIGEIGVVRKSILPTEKGFCAWRTVECERKRSDRGRNRVKVWELKVW